MKVLGNRYQVLEAVGQGAAGIVYKVRDRYDDSVKVAKLLHARSAANPETVRRFEDEFRILSGLHHPSLPHVYDYGWTEDQSRFLVMEYVEGRPLDEYIADHPQDLWVILYQLCEVLSFIHSHHLLHQDIKPGNILVKRTSAYGDQMPLCMLIDFGLTYRRDAGDQVDMVGTPHYMAPEIIRGEAPLTRAVDYYSLGVTLYQLITGDLPFDGDSRQVFDGHLNRPVRFQREKIEYAELYPHIRGLMTKDKRARLEAFEDFKRAVIGRMTGGIHELEQAYGLARINSLGMIGKDEVWNELMEWLEDCERGDDNRVPKVLCIAGEPGSGRSYLLERIEAELKLVGYPPLRPVEIGSYVGTEPLGDEWGATVWDEACRIARNNAAFAAIDDADHLDHSSREVVSYLATRSRIEASSGSAPRLHFILTCEPGSLDSVFPDKQFEFRGVSVLPLRDRDHTRILSEFPGLSSERDAEHLKHFLQNAGDKMARVHEGLTQALLDGSAAFNGGQWSFEFSGLPATVDEKDYYRRLLGSLSEQERRLLFALSCNKIPVAEDAVFQVAEIPRNDAPVMLARLEALLLISVRSPSSYVVLECRSENVRSNVHALVPESLGRQLHARFLQIAEHSWLDGNNESTDSRRVARQVSFHQEFLGNHREAAKWLLVALRESEQSGDLRGIRHAVDDGLTLCEVWTKQQPSSAAVQPFRRYLIKRLLLAEWGRANYHEVRRVIENSFGSNASHVPLSFMPKYARALQATGDVGVAAEVISAALERAHVNSVPHLQLQVELVLVARQSSDMDMALNLIEQIRPSLSMLNDYYQCRFYVGCAITYESSGMREQALKATAMAEEVSASNDFAYELAWVYQARANVQFDSQQLSEAMSTIARGIRFSGRRGLHKNQGSLYFIASAVYYSMGQYDRCLRYLGKALRVAERLGDLVNVAVYLTRFAMIHHGQGSFGNALRFLNRAANLRGSRMTPEGVVVLELVRCEIHLDMGVTYIDSRLTALIEKYRDQLTSFRLGYYEFLVGRKHEAVGELTAAAEHYAAANQIFRDADVPDDELMSAVRLARVARQAGDMTQYEQLLEQLSLRVVDVESTNAAAQYDMLRLEEFVERGQAPDREFLEKCEEGRKEVTERPLQLVYDAVLYRAWYLAADERRSEETFQRFHKNVKGMVAGMPSDADVERFLAQRHIAETFAHFRAAKRVQQQGDPPAR